MEVDLYYNDLFSIDESIKFMKKWYFINGEEDESNENNFMDKECN